jgi:hypothetical protein
MNVAELNKEPRELNGDEVERVTGGGIVDDSVSPRFQSLRDAELVVTTGATSVAHKPS